jgi:hypothetical protein
MVTHIKRRTMTVGVQEQVAREIFKPTKEEVTGGWKKLHNEDLHDLCILCSTIKVMKIRRMRLAGYMACMGENKCLHGFGGKT